MLKSREKDAKSLLQELTQRHYQERPVYHLIGSDGPEHAKVFRVSLTLPDSRMFEAEGPSLKRAEQAVAAKALAVLTE
jgi:ribonuclease-3